MPKWRNSDIAKTATEDEENLRNYTASQPVGQEEHKSARHTHSLGSLPYKSTTPKLNLACPVQTVDMRFFFVFQVKLEPKASRSTEPNKTAILSSPLHLFFSLTRCIGGDKAQKKGKKKKFFVDLRSRVMQRPLLDSLSVL